MDLTPTASPLVETNILSLSADKSFEYLPKTLTLHNQARANYLPTYPSEFATSKHAALLANVSGLSFPPNM